MSDRSARSRGRLITFGVLAAVAIVTCIRLGIWQLDRLAQRRAYNAAVAARLDAPVEPLGVAMARDTGEARWRRAEVRGVGEYARDVAIAARTRAGSPGVWLVTPVRLPGTDTLLPLVRGWVYSPDGRTVDFERWHDADTIAVVARLDAFHTARRGAPRLESEPRAFRWLDRDTLAREWGAPVTPLLAYELPASPADTIGGYDTGVTAAPARLPLPALDEGPHLSYALQWFGFATVFAVGFGVFALRPPRTRRE